MARIKNWDKTLDNSYKVSWVNRLTGAHLEIIHVLGKDLHLEHVFGKDLYMVNLLLKEHPKTPIQFGPFRIKEFAVREAVRLMKKYTGAKKR